MSEASPESCDVDALLTEVAAIDMALLRHVHQQALAATEPDTLNGLVRSQQRLARSVRTTLVAREKLKREQAEAARRAADLARYAPKPAEARSGPPGPDELLHEAVAQRIRLEYDPEEADAIEDELGFMIDEVWDEEGYGRILPAQRLARMLDLVHATFGPSQTRTPEPDPEPEAAAPQPEPPPDATPDPSTAEPYIPPWERRPRHARNRGGGGDW